MILVEFTLVLKEFGLKIIALVLSYMMMLTFFFSDTLYHFSQEFLMSNDFPEFICCIK